VNPKARDGDLLIEELGAELVAYDQQTNKVHSLNRTAALVLKNCDGKNNVADIARVLEQELHTPASEDLVWATLEELEKVDLLVKTQASERRLSRRQTLGWMAAAVLPAIVTLAVPTPAEATPGSAT